MQPYYIIIADDFNRVCNPKGGFKKYTTHEEAVKTAKTLIHKGYQDGFTILQCHPVTHVGEPPKEIPTQVLAGL